MEAATSRRRKVTDEELREAERGLVRLLFAKRFPREWIERNVPDVMAQARSDFAARLVAGKEDDTVNLLVVIGYRRAVKALDAELSRPSTTSLEEVFHLADDSTPTPEEEAIHHDLQEQIVGAMAQLPERERKLLALVYSDEKSIRDAGRRLGWGKSSADRHHRAALEKLHELLDRSLLSPEISVPAYIAARHWQHSPLRALGHWVQGAGETLSEGLMLVSGRLGQVAEGASAAAGGGGGRAAAGLCGAAVAVCLTGAATGVIDSGAGVLGSGEQAPRPASRRAASHEPAGEVQLRTAPSAPEQARTTRSGPSTSSTSKGSGTGGKAAPTLIEAREPHARERRGENVSQSPAATSKETVEEFGVESSGVQSSPESSAESSPPPPSSPAPAPAPAARALPAQPSSPSGSSGSSSGSATGSEFGM